MGKAFNIEYGNIEKKKVTSNRCYPNSKIGNGPKTDPKRTRNGPPMGWGGGGLTADDDRGCYDPVDPPV